MDTTRYSVIVNNEDVVFIGSFDRASSVGFVRRQSGDRVVVRRVQQDDYENHSVYCEMRRLEQVAESQDVLTTIEHILSDKRSCPTGGVWKDPVNYRSARYAGTI